MRNLAVLVVVIALAGCAREPGGPIVVELSPTMRLALEGTVAMMAPGDTLHARATNGEYYPIAVKQGPRLPDEVRRVARAWVVSRGDSFHVYFSDTGEMWAVAPPWCDVVPR